MLTNPNCAFNISVSAQNFEVKPDSSEMFGLYFTNQSATTDEVVQFALEGKAFCYNFHTENKEGKIRRGDKREDTYISTDTFFYDFDKMTIPMNEFIESLKFKPTFGYTSYSNGLDGYRYRLVYVFDQTVYGNQSWDMVYNAIGGANDFQKEEEDKGGWDYRKVNQMYFGTKPEADTYKSYIIYSISDFESFFRTVHCTDDFPFKNKERKDVYTSYSQMEKQFSEDFYSMTSKDFLEKYDSVYLGSYFESLRTPLILSDDQMYFTYPEDYQEVKRNWMSVNGKRQVVKWDVGQGRKRKLYITAQIMKHNLPTITLENLVYNLVKEKFTYYENKDKKLSKDVIVGTAQNALSHTVNLNPCKHPQFSVNKNYWLRDNITPNQAKQYVRKMKKEEEVLSLYDFGISVKENLEFLHKQGIKVGKSYLYELVKRYAFPFKNKEKEDVHTSYSQMENTFQQNAAVIIIQTIGALINDILDMMTDDKHLMYQE